MATQYYAAYGSNLHPARLRARVSSAELLGTARLPGYFLEFHKRGMDGSGKCGIATPGDGVYVAVYAMDAREKPELDRHEHAGVGYDVASLVIPGFGECFSYRARQSHVTDALPPWCWYREMVLLGCALHGFPAGYTERLRGARFRQDPDDDRRERQWALVEQMRADGPNGR